MQVDFAHGLYIPRPALFGGLVPADAEAFASMQASLDAFYNSMRDAAAGDRNAMLASAIASLHASAGHAAEAAYNQAKTAGQSEDQAKAAAQAVVQLYQAQEADYRQAAAKAASETEVQTDAAISARAAQARAALNQAFNLTSAGAAPASSSSLPLLLTAGAALYFAMKG